MKSEIKINSTKESIVPAKKPMIIAIINKSGNVGKTTLGSCLIATRLENLKMVAYIESTNYTPNRIPEPVGVGYGAHEFGEVEAELLDIKMNGGSAVIDFGASDFNVTMEMLSQYTEARDRMDFYIVPCPPGKKEQIDTIVTIETLIGLDVPPEKIKVLFNQVMLRDKHNLRRLFSGIFTLQSQILEKNGSTFFADENVTMFQVDAFKRLMDSGLSFSEMVTDQIDYDHAVMAEPDKEKKFKLAEKLGIRGAVRSTEKAMAQIFEKLIPRG